jgi:hypothetical protein
VLVPLSTLIQINERVSFGSNPLSYGLVATNVVPLVSWFDALAILVPAGNETTTVQPFSEFTDLFVTETASEYPP